MVESDNKESPNTPDSSFQDENRVSVRVRRALLRVVIILAVAGVIWLAEYLGYPLGGGQHQEPAPSPKDVSVSISPDVSSNTNKSVEIPVNLDEVVVTPMAKKQAHSSSITRDQMVGRWKLDGTFYREVDMRSDGTATMTVKLDYFTGLLYAREMTFELNWQFRNGILSHSIVSGNPKAAVERIAKDFGSTTQYRVLSASNGELVLGSAQTGREQDRWVAVK